MEIIKKICEENPVSYELGFDLRLKNVQLAFSENVPSALRDCVRGVLEHLGVPVGGGGLGVERITVAPLADAPDFYSVTPSGKKTITVREMPGQETGESIAWVIYLIAAGEYGTLAASTGDHVFAMRFSARQQAAAAGLMGVIQYQFSNRNDPDFLRKFCEGLLKMVEGAVALVPRFSDQPIPGEIYKKLNGKKTVRCLAELANALFGPTDFGKTIRAYVDETSESYGFLEQEKRAAELLCDTVYRIPLSSVTYFCSAMEQFADEIPVPEDSQIRSLMYKQGEMAVSLADRNVLLRDVNEIYRRMAAAMLYRKFLRDVVGMARSRIESEKDESGKWIRRIGMELNSFVLTDGDCFPAQTARLKNLSWKNLPALRREDLRCPDVFWDVRSFDNLQNNVSSRGMVPHIWLCSERLYNLSQDAQISCIRQLRHVPIQHERYVWAIFTDKMGV